jgi:hypothetical protein
MLTALQTGKQNLRYKYYVSEHYPLSCLYFKTAFQSLDSISVFREKLLSWAQLIVGPYIRSPSKFR